MYVYECVDLLGGYAASCWYVKYGIAVLVLYDEEVIIPLTVWLDESPTLI